MVHRRAFSLIELLVGIGVISVLIGFLMPAVQRARDTSLRLKCLNNLRQIGLALHMQHNLDGHFPDGHLLMSQPGRSSVFPETSWLLTITPQIELPTLVPLSQSAYRIQQSNVWLPPNPIDVFVPLFVCPADGRIGSPQTTPSIGGALVAFTSYLGSAGRSAALKDGVIFAGSKVRIDDIIDGTSNTLMAGERPPSSDLEYGWWYAGVGYDNQGSLEHVMGVNELNIPNGAPGSLCPIGPYSYGPGRFDDSCAMFHFWGPHLTGANFLFADGSARLLPYSAVAIMPALATRAGGDLGNSAE